jgi:AcrR family transcriptional regulator
MEATIALMVERGVHAVSVDAIAERSAVAKTTVYRHWPTREALILAAWSTLAPIDTGTPTGDLREQVETTAIAFAQRIGTSPMSVLLPDLLALARRDPGMRAVYDELLRARRRPVADVISGAVVNGLLPTDTDAELVAELILGPIVYRQLVHLEPVDPVFIAHLTSTVLAAATQDMVKTVKRPRRAARAPSVRRRR